MDEWLKEVVQKIESEGNKITSIKIVTKDATEFIKPEKIKTEREKVCDELLFMLEDYKHIDANPTRLFIDYITQVRSRK